jgi:hypothetical protein
MLKIVFFYNQYSSGWSETYYAPGSDPKSFADSLTPTFLSNSVKFRNATTVLKAVRITRIEAPRFSYLVRPYPSPQGTIISSGENGPDVASVDAVILLQGSTSATRRIFVRGLSDFDTRRDAFGNDLLGTNISKGVDLFVKGMKAYNFAIRYVTRPPNGALVWQKVGTLFKSIINPLWVDFVLAPNVPTHEIGSYLSVTGIPSALLPRFPRNAQIAAKSIVGGETTYSVAYALPGGVNVSAKNLRVTTLLPAYEPIADWQFERFSEHKTGRPFGLLRGRSRGIAVAR